jgi:hypothetical protein
MENTLSRYSDDELLVLVALILSKPSRDVVVSEDDWAELQDIQTEIQNREVRRLGYVPMEWAEA